MIVARGALAQKGVTLPLVEMDELSKKADKKCGDIPFNIGAGAA